MLSFTAANDGDSLASVLKSAPPTPKEPSGALYLGPNPLLTWCFITLIDDHWLNRWFHWLVQNSDFSYSFIPSTFFSWHSWAVWWTWKATTGKPRSYLIPYFFFFFLPMAYRSSQARGWIGAAAAGLCPATVMWDPSHIWDLHHSLRQCRILNPLSKARDWTRILIDTSRILKPLSHNGNSLKIILNKCLLILSESCSIH